MCKCDEELINSINPEEHSLTEICWLMMFFEGIHSADCEHCELF